MMTVRIYQPPKSAMQSGKGHRNQWVVRFEPLTPSIPDPVMGWPSSTDMAQELSLSFPSLEKAIEFSKLRGLDYTIFSPSKIKLTPKNYAHNFKKSIPVG